MARRADRASCWFAAGNDDAQIVDCDVKSCNPKRWRPVYADIVQAPRGLPDAVVLSCVPVLEWVLQPQCAVCGIARATCGGHWEEGGWQLLRDVRAGSVRGSVGACGGRKTLH